MEDNKALKIDMTDFLLNITLKDLDKKIIEKNIEKIADRLNDIDTEKDKDKYVTLSCIFGAFLGDSMGSACEFSPKSNKNHESIFKIKNGIFEPGEVTDDSEMAMSAAFAYIDLINEDPLITQDLIYYYFCVWGASGPKDIGNATSNALRHWTTKSFQETNFNYKIVKIQNWDSLANGFLMRISTFITYFYYNNLSYIKETIETYFKTNRNKTDELTDEMINLYIKIFNESIKNTEITHPNYENGISSAVFTLMCLTGMVMKDAKLVYLLFYQISKSQKFICNFEENKYLIYSLKSTQKKYNEIIKDIENKNEPSVTSLIGYYMHGFKLSVYYLYKYPEMAENQDTDLYYKIMCDVCDYGGDTDTNCAIVGAMIGPLIGYKNFSKELFDTFIKFIPEERCQFNSAFMYVYVDYLEKKMKEKNVTTKENVDSEQKQNNLEADHLKEDKKEENKEKGKGKGFIQGIKNIFGKGKLKEKEDKEKQKIEEIEKERIKKNFKYTAFKMIKEFLTKEINI